MSSHLKVISSTTSIQNLADDHNRAQSTLRGMRNRIALALTGVFVIVIIIGVNVYLLTRTVQSSPLEENEMPIALDSNTETVLKFINRSEWSASIRKDKLPDLIFPVGTVVIAHTNDNSCKIDSECIDTVNFLQRKYTKNQYKVDIPFNFLIGENGVVLEGTGWTTQSDTMKGK